MIYERELEKFYKQLLEFYPGLKGWKLKVVLFTTAGQRYGGYCNRARKTLEVSTGSLMSSLDARIVLLHEAIHAVTGVSEHGPGFANPYKRALKHWFGIEEDEMETAPDGTYLSLKPKNSLNTHT